MQPEAHEKEDEHRKNVKRKSQFHDCYLTNTNGEKVLVCKAMFLGTLDLGKHQFAHWCEDGFKPAWPATSDDAGEDLTVVSPATKTRKDKKRRSVVSDWLDILPKVPSHYCRASSKKTYVESTCRSYNRMHQTYSKYVNEKGEEPVSRQVFVDVLKEKKIDIHSPRKDQCDVCVSYKCKMVSQEEYDLHLVKKNEARAAKNSAQTIQQCYKNGRHDGLAKYSIGTEDFCFGRILQNEASDSQFYDL